ncbi:MAG: hypothetical protein ACOYNY_28880 [Caldilineaceae bacterium]
MGYGGETSIPGKGDGRFLLPKVHSPFPGMLVGLEPESAPTQAPDFPSVAMEAEALRVTIGGGIVIGIAQNRTPLWHWDIIVSPLVTQLAALEECVQKVCQQVVVLTHAFTPSGCSMLSYMAELEKRRNQ